MLSDLLVEEGGFFLFLRYKCYDSNSSHVGREKQLLLYFHVIVTQGLTNE